MLTALMSALPTPIFRRYVDDLPHGQVTVLASRLGIHTVYLSQLASRHNGRQPSPELCVDIERATDGAVTRRDLRPSDWWRIWPELITADHPAPGPAGRPLLDVSATKPQATTMEASLAA